MKYINIPEPGKVVIRDDMPVPVPGKGEALLRVLYGGICGSDLSTYRGTMAYAAYPRTPGHEIAAEIVSVEPNALGLHSGQTVTVNPYFNCGKCYSCRRGLVNCCTSNETMGVQREGGFAEYITMPLERIYDGKGIDAPVLALIEPFCISYHGIKRASVKNGDRVLVVGGGTIGVFAAVSAKHFGAEVYVCDIAEDKLKYAREFGVDGVFVNSSPESLAENTARITGGDGFDVAVEAVGLPGTFQNCIDAAAFGGSVLLIGVGKKNLDFNFTLIQKKELNIFGSRNALKEDFIELIDLVSSGAVDIRNAITDSYSAWDAPKAFADFSERGGEMLKISLKF